MRANHSIPPSTYSIMYRVLHVLSLTCVTPRDLFQMMCHVQLSYDPLLLLLTLNLQVVVFPISVRLHLLLALPTTTK